MAVGLSSVGQEMNETWNECRHLLFDLKTTVEGLLANQTTNVWNTYGGLSRLTNVVNNILSHRLKSYQGAFDYWNFIMGLRVLVPSIAPWLERFRLQNEGNPDRSTAWIRQRLQEHTLSIHLNILVGDNRHLKSCYEDEAFLRQEVFCKSLLTCLHAVENNHLPTLSELNPSLLVERVQATAGPIHPHLHRRSPSLPTNLSDLAAGPVTLHPRSGSSLCAGDDQHQPHQQQKPLSSNPVHHSDHLHSRPRRPSRHPPLPPLGDLSPPSEGPKRDQSLKKVPKSITWHCGLSLTEGDRAPLDQRRKPSIHQGGEVFVAKRNNGQRRRHQSESSLASQEWDGQTPCRWTRSCRDIIGAESESGEFERTKQTLKSWWKAERRCSTDVRSGAGSGCNAGHGAGFSAGAGFGTESSAGYVAGSSAGSSVGSEEASRLPVVDYHHRSLESSMSEDVLSTLPEVVPRPSHPAPTSYRLPSHVRSKSDVVGGGGAVGPKVVLADRRATVVSQAVSSIPMSSSLPSDLNCRAGPSTDDEYYTQPFRPPMQGQSLTSFLLQQDFSTCADLERENAHFNISEALIAAIEQIKCKQMQRIAEEQDGESDDDVIMHLKQRIRIRRRERLQEKVPYRSPNLLSDGRTDTTSQSPSPRSTSSENKSGNTSDSVDPIDLSDGSEADSKIGTLNESKGLSLSMASLYSDADILRPPPPHQSTPLLPAAAPVSTSTTMTAAPVPQERSERSGSVLESLTAYVSAESVALSLLKRFSEKQLPKASDLDWLVSEQEAPQKLLPLPGSWPVSPDDAENGQQQFQTQTRLRGNMEWAPPRPQVIFSIHPAPQRKVIMVKQNYRCAGCGTKVEPGYMRRFRYCEYLGKYFCQCCHNNGLAYIPAKILRKWDFSRCHVSNFSRDVLERMCDEPLYDIADVNPALYRRVKALNHIQHFRLQLFSIKDFVRVCRDGTSLAEELDRQPSHLIANPHLYSVNDLIRVKSGEMASHLKALVNQALQHIKQCQLCQARGFYCEFCKNKEIIFPFQLGKVSQCSECWTCYHSECFVPDKCPKCLRIEARKLRLLQSDDTD